MSTTLYVYISVRLHVYGYTCLWLCIHDYALVPVPLVHAHTPIACGAGDDEKME